LPSPKTKPTPKKHLTPTIATYCDRALGWRDLLLTFIPATLATLSPYFYGLWRVQYARIKFGPSAAGTWGWPWFALSLVALIPLLWLAIRRVRQAHRKIDVYTKGIVIYKPGRRKQTVYWDTITGIADTKVEYRFLGLQLRVAHESTIFLLGGDQIKFDKRIRGLDELCARIKAKVYPRLLPNYRAVLKNGGTLSFGMISFNQQTITIRNDGLLSQETIVPWKQVSRLEPRDGFLVVEFYEKRGIKIPVGQVPNTEILIQLIQEGIAG